MRGPDFFCRLPMYILYVFRSLVFLLGWLSGAALAADLDAQQATTSLVKQLSSMKSMDADFHQWVLDGRQTVLQEVKGTMKIQRPGMFRWDSLEPYPQQITTDSATLWVYDKDLDQVTRKSLDRQVGNTPALLLSGDPQALSLSFSISGHHFDGSDEIRYDLVPTDKNAMFELLRVHFKAGKLSEMYLRDNLGHTTRIVFTLRSLNQPISPETFRFVPPPGTDVISDE
jgi:outer membrane lipoprotein carrier protein